MKSRKQMASEEATISPVFLLQKKQGRSYVTESVWYSREEADAYLQDNAHNFRSGGRVYSVPCYGVMQVALAEYDSNHQNGGSK